MIQEPIQARSHDSYRRIVDAAVHLIESGGFERTSVRAISRRAGLTTGAFYARFADKESLGLAFVERIQAMSERLVTDFEEAVNGQGPLVAVRVLLEGAADLYADHRALFRTTTTIAHTNQEVAAVLRGLNRSVLARAVTAVLDSGVKIDHPNPPFVVQTALVTALNQIRVLQLDPPLLNEDRESDIDPLIDELTVMVGRYMRIYEGAGAGA